MQNEIQVAKKSNPNKKMKPVYFNIENEKERELFEWVNNRFATFGGLVKDLLHTQMILEKEGKTVKHYSKNIDEVADNQMTINDYNLNENDVEDFDC